MKCSLHDLAQGPDGRCVVCRRDDLKASSVAARRTAAWLVVGLGCVTGSLFAVQAARHRPAPAPLATRESPNVAAPSSAAAEQASAESADTASVATPEAETPAGPAALPNREAPSRSPQTAAPAASQAAPNAELAAGGSRQQPGPSAEELARALRQTPIVMFSTSWCPACKQARAFFRDNAVPVQERDIDHDDAARDELKRRTGKTQIPTLVIDGDQLAPGFSTERVMAAMRASVERRLGVQGLQLERIAPGG